MKAVLVIEVDDELVNKMHGCDFVVTDRYGSNIIYPIISFKPIPQKKDLDWDDYTYGYNDCIDEILGEEK